jgi:hypothetical protein
VDLNLSWGKTKVWSSPKCERSENRFTNQDKLDVVAERGVVILKFFWFLNKCWKSLICAPIKIDGLVVLKKSLANWLEDIVEKISLSHKFWLLFGIKFENVFVNWRVLETDDKIWLVFRCKIE